MGTGSLRRHARSEEWIWERQPFDVARGRERFGRWISEATIADCRFRIEDYRLSACRSNP